MARRRSGTSLLEAIVGLFIMAVVITLVAQLSAFASRQLQAGSARRLAAQEAANLIDQIAASPWNAVTRQTAAEWQLSQDALRQLPHAQLHVTVSDEAGQAEAKQITLDISWTGHWGGQTEHVRLVSWKYQLAEDESG